MTVHRWPLLFLSAATTLFLPACLVISGDSLPIVHDSREKAATEETKATDPAHKPLSGFAELRPGGIISARAAKDGKDSKDGKDGKDTTTAQKPAGNPRVDAPISPLNNDVKVAEDPPGPLPGIPALHPSIPLEPPLVAAVRAHAEGHPDRAIEFLKALDPPNQEYVLEMLPVLARGATGDLTDATAAAVLADQHRGVASRLAARASLLAENVVLCRKVYGFARYDPWPENQPYRPNDQAQLYLEVRNLVSQVVAGPHGETHLTHVSVAVEIRDARGRLVEQADPDDWRRRVQVVRFERKQLSRGPVEDFYIYHPFAVPSAPGVYTVTVELRDPAGRRNVRTNPVRFDVSGP
jgi:hypothetical protein